MPYTGREPEPGSRNRYPLEDPAEGCPAGWRSTVYLASIAPYLRVRLEHGARLQNPFFDRCTDPAILLAVLYFEGQQERCIEQIEASEAAERARQLERLANGT